MLTTSAPAPPSKAQTDNVTSTLDPSSPQHCPRHEFLAPGPLKNSRHLKRSSTAQDTKSWPLAPSSTLDTASAPALPKTRNPGPWTPHSIPSNVDKDVYSIERFPVLKTIIGGIHCIVRTSHQLLHFPYAASFIPA